MAGSVDDLRLELSEFESKVTSMERSLQSVWSICVFVFAQFIFMFFK